MKDKKKKLRNIILKQLEGFDSSNESKQLIILLKKLDAWKNAKNIMIYSPLAGEINLFPLLKEKDKHFYFPKISDSALEVCHAKSEGDFIKKKFDILEPKPYCKKIDPKDLDLIIVPGIAFDTSGNRLGRGKGYYDKFLTELKKEGKATTIALSFSLQIVEEVPTEAHDEKIDRVLSI